MLKLSLTPGEYLTIGEDVVVQVYRCEGGRSYLAIDAPRDVPIVRGTVREREGGQRPKAVRDRWDGRSAKPNDVPLAHVPPKGHKSDNPL